ncbi:hypothetical protein [Caballeronia sp. RCC_10]|uniref:hypothetical protein n=1 Tax=Caballeronia sp. RCC_10 TaxID=3239227 RepID=UPI003526ADDE
MTTARWPSDVPRVQADFLALRYPWDDWIGEDDADLLDDELLDKQNEISDRANLALATGCTEWIVYRYQRLSNDPVPYDELEAMWAAVIDTRYMRPWEPDRDLWSGPVRGPLLFAMLYAQQAVRDLATQSGPGMAVLYLSGLAEIVLPDYDAFVAWRDETLDHLRKLYPFDPHDTPGDVVPWQALEAPHLFDPRTTEPSVQSFLATLDPERNQCLHRADEMLDLLVERTPYTFELADDRETRNIW